MVYSNTDARCVSVRVKIRREGRKLSLTLVPGPKPVRRALRSVKKKRAVTKGIGAN